jgi:hypothetical protein
VELRGTAPGESGGEEKRKHTFTLGFQKFGFVKAIPVLHDTVLVLVGIGSQTLEQSPRVADEKVVSHLGRADHHIGVDFHDAVGVEGSAACGRLRVYFGISHLWVAAQVGFLEVAVQLVDLVELALVLRGEADILLADGVGDAVETSVLARIRGNGVSHYEFEESATIL